MISNEAVMLGGKAVWWTSLGFSGVGVYISSILDRSRFPTHVRGCWNKKTGKRVIDHTI